MQAKAQLFITFSCSSSCACVRVKHKQQKHGLSQNTPLLPPLLNGFSGLLIFRAVADPRNSGISAKSREIPKKTRNTAKSARNISKYMSAKHI